MLLLASADKPDDFDSISISESGPFKCMAVYNMQIHLNRHPIASNLQVR
jgi:hypothetical protein